MWYFSWCSSWEDDIIGFPDCDDFICERFARCKFDITLEHDIMVLSLRKKIILLEITLSLFSKNFNVLLEIWFSFDSHIQGCHRSDCLTRPNLIKISTVLYGGYGEMAQKVIEGDMSHVKSYYYAWEIEMAQFQNGSKSRSRVLKLRWLTFWAEKNWDGSKFEKKSNSRH